MTLIVKAMLILLAIFFISIALWGFSESYKEFKKRNNKWYKSDYIMKLLFTLFALIFWVIFFHKWLTIEF